MNAANTCPKCGCDRTHRVGPSSVNYRRCDKCEYLFREKNPASAESAGELTSDAACVKCGSHRTHIIGQSGEPRLLHWRCDECGHIASRSPETETADHQSVAAVD